MLVEKNIYLFFISLKGKFAFLFFKSLYNILNSLKTSLARNKMAKVAEPINIQIASVVLSWFAIRGPIAAPVERKSELWKFLFCCYQLILFHQ